MRHSFIAPRDKKVIGNELKWLLVTTGALFVLMLFSSLLLNAAISSKEENLETLLQKRATLLSEHKERSEALQTYKEIDKLREILLTNNHLKKENVKNFLDLVPDVVVLKSAKFNGYTLRLSGMTLSKRVYEQTFQRSLDSLFSKSKTRFRKIIGGYHFTNISVSEQK